MKVRHGVKLALGHVTCVEQEETIAIIVSKESASATQNLELDEARYLADRLYELAKRIEERQAL